MRYVLMVLCLTLAGCGGGATSTCPIGTCDLRVYNSTPDRIVCAEATYTCGRVESLCDLLTPGGARDVVVPAGMADIVFETREGVLIHHLGVLLPAAGWAHINIGDV